MPLGHFSQIYGEFFPPMCHMPSLSRASDIIFALWATTQDLMNNRMKILSMPCRFNKAFPEIPVYADLEVCDFISLDE